jgi:hypothetical protein
MRVMEPGRGRFARMALASALCGALLACSDPDRENIKKTTIPTYDKKTGKLTELTYDRNHNGKIDTWTEMDGTRPVMSRIDLNEDGKIDRWEYYGENGELLKVGFSRKDDGKPDAWAFAGPDGKVSRVEISSTGDEKKIDRWEHYDASQAGPNGDATGVLVSAEEDTDGDGHPDKWETYEHGAIKTVAFDETKSGHPTRRLTYRDGALVLIESNPDGNGAFLTRTPVK